MSYCSGLTKKKGELTLLLLQKKSGRKRGSTKEFPVRFVKECWWSVCAGRTVLFNVSLRRG